MAWTDEKKAEAIKMYQDAEPTPETSTEIVAEIAENLSESVNGVRMILTKADVYVKKAPATKADGASKTGAATGGTRVSKEAAHAQLTAAIEDAGQSADSEIISKLTGKAALYFVGIFTNLK